MKKHFLSLLALILGIGMAQANPVSVSQAKLVGQQFVQANFDLSRQAGELTLVYTGTSTRGEACFYVFNVGNEGFVMVSADDIYRPIVGYSDEGAFDAQNINPELNYMLNELISFRSDKLTGEAAPAVASEWMQVTQRGTQLSFNGGRANTYLCTTRWNQDDPYNYYCPQASGGPGGRTYAGCVATAMSQVMKYWDHPLKGTGSHTNYNSGFGALTVNFGETTYDWDNMPNSINNNSPQEQIDAIATLMYHCGIAVDMHYAIDGSGAYSQDVPQRIYQYFDYTNQAVLRSRDSYSYENWANMLKESFDMGWPVYYSGQSPDGGHAFVCDGYDDANLFHYNWGWGGSGDGWFDFDAIDYNSSDGAIFHFVPGDVYNGTPKAPTNLTVTPAANNELSATITWTNPSQTLNNANLSSITQIVVCRDGEVIYTEDNVTPGAAMTYVDNNVPRFDAFVYSVYATYGDNHGKMAYSEKTSFGPSCGWTINVTQASFTGFRGGAIHVYNAAGTEVAVVTTNTSNVQSFPIDVPLGHVSFGWSAQTSGAAFTMAFTIKDSQNNVVYTYSGQSTDLPEGIFHDQNNGCGNTAGTGVPSNLIAIRDEEDPYTIHVSWDGVDDSGYGYIVYRDELLYRLIPEGTSFDDVNTPIGGHCYRVGFLSDGGENPGFSNESCATSGECYAPSNLDYETTGSTYKIKLKWEKPNPADGLSGYYLFRSTQEDEGYERIKLLGANATSYTDNSANQEGHYYYKLYAVYHDLDDCASAPANWIWDANQFYLHVYYSPTGVEELEDGRQVAVYPNPTTAQFTIEGVGLTHVAVFNTLGQMVYEANCEGNSTEVNLGDVETGVYMVRIATENGTLTKRISVIK
jgi:hypothetical protein